MVHYARAPKADAGSEAPSRFGPTALALFVIVAIVAVVVGLYALSASRKRAAEAQEKALEEPAEKPDPFRDLPPDEPPPRRPG